MIRDQLAALTNQFNGGVADPDGFNVGVGAVQRFSFLSFIFFFFHRGLLFVAFVECLLGNRWAQRVFLRNRCLGGRGLVLDSRGLLMYEA